MDAYDLARKLMYAGSRSPVPFVTGPEYTNSIPGVPVLSSLRVFVPRDHWSDENIFQVAREICRVLGATTQFDIGIAIDGVTKYEAAMAAAGDNARLMKLAQDDPTVTLRLRTTEGDALYQARFPRLQFVKTTADYWRSVYGPGLVKDPAQL